MTAFFNDAKHGIRTLAKRPGFTLTVVLVLALGHTFFVDDETAPGANPVTFICPAMLLSIVALLACYLPARRAARIDPMEALRYE